MFSSIAVDTLGSLDPAVVNTGTISIESSEKNGKGTRLLGQRRRL
jgi:hypothetical protein